MLFSGSPILRLLSMLLILWISVPSAISAEFEERLLVGMSVGDKKLGIRLLSLDRNKFLVLPASVFKTICKISDDEECRSFRTGQQWYNEYVLRRMGINVKFVPKDFELKIELPNRWMRKVRAKPNKPSDAKPYKYSYRYLKFIHLHQKDNNLYGELIREMLSKASESERMAFLKNAWKYPIKIIQDPSEVARYTPEQSSSLSLSSAGKVLSDEIDNQIKNVTQGSPQGQNVSLAKNLSAQDTQGQSTQTITQKTTTTRVTTRRSSPSSIPQNTGTTVDKVYVSQNISGSSMNDEILKELKGMHRILQRMSENQSLNSQEGGGYNSSIEQVDSALIREASRNPATIPLDSATLAEKEKQDYDKIRKLSREELFQKAFGRKPKPRPNNIVVQLFLDGRALEKVKLDFDAKHTKYRFRSNALEKTLDTLLLEETITALEYKRDGLFHNDKVVATGIEMKLNESEFTLYLNIPGEKKRLQVHDYGKDQFVSDLPSIKPASISAFLNLSFIQDATYREFFFANDSIETLYRNLFDENGVKRVPFILEADGALNAFGWVLEAEGKMLEPHNFDSPKDSIWKNLYREEIRLVRDWSSLDMRFSIGDVNARTSEMNVRMPGMIGFNVFKKPGAMSQYRQSNSHAGPEVQIVLDAPALVEIFVNDQLFKSQNYSSGLHVIKGIRGSVGENVLRIVMKYEDGRVGEKVEHFVQGGGYNLASGEIEFEVSGGIPKTENWGPDHFSNFENDSLGVGGYFRYGLHEFFTTSAYGAATPKNQAAGLGLLWRNDSVGSTEIKFFGSSHDSLGQGFKSEIIRGWKFKAASVYLSAGYYTKHYLRSLYGKNDNRLDALTLRGAFGSKLWGGRLNVSLQSSFNRKDSVKLKAPIEYHASASYNLSPLDGLNVGVSSSVNVTKDQYLPQLNLTLSYFFNTGHHNYYAMNQLTRDKRYKPPTLKKETIKDERGLDKDTLIMKPGYWQDEWNNNLSAGWSWSEASGYNNGKQMSAGLGWREKSGSLRVGGVRTMNHGQVFSNYSLSDNSRTSMQTRSHYLSTRVETSFSFADGLFAWGRPIRDNFLLADGIRNLSSTAIRLNPNEEFNTEFSRSWGPFAAVYGDLQSYRENIVQLKLVNPVIGAWLKHNTYSITPGYKRGYALRVGTYPTVLVRARLLDAVGDPVSRVAFTLVDKENPDIIILESFTNKRGVFQAGKLEPGKTYIMKFGNDAYIQNLEIEVPEESQGVYNLKDIQVKHESLGKMSRK